MHIPVLKERAVELWASLDKNDKALEGIYVDATFGAGGHSSFLLQMSPKDSDVIVIGIDWDRKQYQKSKLKYQKLIKKERLFLVNDNYTNLDKIVSSFQKQNHVLSSVEGKDKLPVRGVLFDFGLCTDQLAAKRGFSFEEPRAPLDMRFDREYNDLTAAKILNDWPEERLASIFQDLGEERYSRKAARAITKYREGGKEFNTVADLLAVLKKVLAPAYRRQRIHYATRVFQTLRMAVNKEKENIFQGLCAARDILARGGRIAAISFHSGEDRIVKNFFRAEAKDCLCPPQIPQCVCQHRKTFKIITKKPITPSEQEIDSNPNARSAKLRAAEKT